VLVVAVRHAGQAFAERRDDGLQGVGLALLLFGILPQPLMAICFIAIQAL